jgi:hypothetical protein
VSPVGRAAAWVATVLAVASAAVTAYWIAGGPALLDTVGGAMEAMARERSASALLVGSATVVAKLVAALLALALLGRPPRPVRWLAGLAGGLLTLWGGANVLVGGVALTGVLDLGTVTDPRALRWHVLLWDAWFLVWGVALLVAVWTTWRRRGQRNRAVEPRSTSTGSTSSAGGTGRALSAPVSWASRAAAARWASASARLSTVVNGGFHHS